LSRGVTNRAKKKAGKRGGLRLEDAKKAAGERLFQKGRGFSSLGGHREAMQEVKRGAAEK